MIITALNVARKGKAGKIRGDMDQTIPLCVEDGMLMI